jgi:RND family efflux transporter MFP subunit
MDFRTNNGGWIMISFRLLLNIIIPALILIAAFGFSHWLTSNPEKAEKNKEIKTQVMLVKTGFPEVGNYTVPIEALGQVIPSTEIHLKSQVSGEIIAISEEFLPGGLINKDEIILKIDPSDYKISVQKYEAVLKQAEANYDLELGRQNIAKSELELLKKTTGKPINNTELALRRPQLEQANAEKIKAKSDLDKAKLDFNRTEIKAPYNALIVDRNANIGDKVSSQDSLARIVATDEYWIELSIPVNELKWLDIPYSNSEQGSKAYIFLDGDRGTRTGHILKLTGKLDDQSRFANILLSVRDPLLINNTAKSAFPLILGDYVKVILDGKTLNNALRIPLSWLRDENTVWVMKEGKLVFKPITPIYEDREYIYIQDGLKPSDKIITSDISVPVNGMPIRTLQEARLDVKDKMTKPKTIKKKE